MKLIKDLHGIGTFDLIHDMFTVDRKRVVEFCDALLAFGEEFHWNCSARTDCVDERLIALMAEAGCRGIFFGIETGSARMQRIIQKDLDLRYATRMIRCADKHQIRTAVSLITGFPDESPDDLRDTVGFLVDSLRFDHAEPQLHILAPLAETPIHTQYRDKLTFDYILSDMSYQGWRQDPADQMMIREYPDIFPNFYAVPTPWLDRQYLKEVRDFLLNGLRYFRWLLLALHRNSGDVLKVFDKWQVWRAGKRPARPVPDEQCNSQSSAVEFKEDFVQFVQDNYASTANNSGLRIKALVEYETAVRAPGVREVSAPGESSVEPIGPREPLGLDAVPCITKGLHLVILSADYKEVVRSIKRKGKLDRVPVTPVTLVTRKSAESTIEVIQLSDLSAQLLEICDGNRTVEQIVERFSSLGHTVDDIPLDKVCIFGLELLHQQGLIVRGFQ